MPLLGPKVITPKQTRFLSHVLDFVKAGGKLGVESLKRAPRVARWAAKTRGGTFTAGVGVGGVAGYKVGRKLQGMAYGYSHPRGRE
jgi:hypothetical protein